MLGPALLPSRVLPDVRRMPKMVPHGRPASMLADPSNGSKTAAYSPLLKIHRGRRNRKKRSQDRGGCTQFVHGRSCMTIDPRIPTMPGRSTSGFHQTGRHCLHQARSAVRGREKNTLTKTVRLNQKNIPWLAGGKSVGFCRSSGRSYRVERLLG